MKQTAQRIFRETLAAIDIPSTLARKLDRSDSLVHLGGNSFNLNEFREIVAIAYGKASIAMAEGLCEVLAPEFLTDGILVAPVASTRPLPGWTNICWRASFAECGELCGGARDSGSTGALR